MTALGSIRPQLLLLVLAACGGEATSTPEPAQAAGAVTGAATTSAEVPDAGGPSEGGAVDPAPGAVAPDDCTAACSPKVLACGTPASMVPAVCLAVCDSSAAQQACVDVESCDTLAHSFEQTRSFCGIGCLSLCAAKAATCGAPSDVAGPACARLCGLSPSLSSIDCLLGSSCSDLEQGYRSGGEVCGIEVGGQ